MLGAETYLDRTTESLVGQALWNIIKGKWIRPQYHGRTDMLFYATNRALAFYK